MGNSITPTSKMMENQPARKLNMNWKLGLYAGLVIFNKRISLRVLCSPTVMVSLFLGVG